MVGWGGWTDPPSARNLLPITLPLPGSLSAGSLSALVYQHSIIPLALPCKLVIPNRGRNLRPSPSLPPLCLSPQPAAPERGPGLEETGHAANLGKRETTLCFIFSNKKRRENSLKSLIPETYIIDLPDCSGKFSGGFKNSSLCPQK